MMTPIAAASPRLKSLKARVYTSIVNVSVDRNGPPSVINQIELKLLNVYIVVRVTAKMTVGLISGRVMCCKDFKLPAPSTLAASYSSSGTACRPGQQGS